GRLLSLQGQFSLAQLMRRLVQGWGARSTLERAAQRMIRSMVRWGVRRDSAMRGMYEALPPRKKVGPHVGTVLIEALLVDAKRTALPIDQLIGNPVLFPFELDLNAGHVRASGQFRVHREGLNCDFV